MRFKVQPRLRSFARLVTQNYKLRVLFQGEVPSISGNTMFIPQVANTPEAFSRAQFSVAHECSHSLFTEMGLKEKAGKEDPRLPKILNALEDARTERLMIKQFEGLESLMDENVRQIVETWDVSSMPLARQVLLGLYLAGREFEIPFGDDCRKILSELDPLIAEAADAPDTKTVLRISREVLRILDKLIDDLPEAKPMRGSGFGDSDMSDAITERVTKVRIDDDMDDNPHLRDENAPEAETIYVLEESPLSDYLAQLAPLRSEMNYLIQHMQSIVDTKRARKRMKSFRTSRRGTVNTKRIWKVAMNSDEIMKRRSIHANNGYDVDPDSLAVYILLDESHSMLQRDRIFHARQAAMVVCEALAGLGISFALTGYTTREKLFRFPYKEFDEEWTDVRTRVMSMTHRLGTFTSEHIPFALRRLVKRQERKKILIVITDSDDIESPYRLKEAILDVQDEGIEIIGIGIATSLMSHWYDRYIEVEDMTGFARMMLELLRGVVNR
jgi:cobalamin biosynthesis protein CobT